jgi:hypothetical protein
MILEGKFQEGDSVKVDIDMQGQSLVLARKH